MRSTHRVTVIALSAALLLAVVGPGMAMAQEETTEDGDSLDVAVDGLVVSVTDNDTAVANATVDVSVVDDNVTYNGTGTYVTDENGTVGLPAPEETVNVSVTASTDNASASTTATLEAEEAEEDAGESGDAFGQEVQAYVHSLLNGEGGDVPMGFQVASFVTENNPGNAPDHAGPKDGQGPPEHAGPDGERGPSDHAGPDGERGPPSDDTEETEETDDGDTEETEETADTEESDEGDTDDA